jgi:hypothetical protein
VEHLPDHGDTPRVERAVACEEDNEEAASRSRCSDVIMNRVLHKGSNFCFGVSKRIVHCFRPPVQTVGFAVAGATAGVGLRPSGSAMPQDVRRHAGRLGVTTKQHRPSFVTRRVTTRPMTGKGAPSVPLADASEERLGTSCAIRADSASGADVLPD